MKTNKYEIDMCNGTIMDKLISFSLMNEMELMMHLHLNNDRQGPGSEEMTRLALDIARVDKAACYRMADLGCGTGAQTLTLWVGVPDGICLPPFK